MAMQQDGFSLLLTILIISAPPIAAQFFRGVLGSFTPYSGFNSSAGYSTPPKVQQQQASTSYQPGHPGYPGGAPSPNTARSEMGGNQAPPQLTQTRQVTDSAMATSNNVRSADEARMGNAGVNNGNIANPSSAPAPQSGPPRGGTQ